MPADSQPETLGPARFAVLTPSGRGAIASIGVRGKQARAIVARRFTAAAGASLDKLPVGRVVFGRFRGLEGAPEELVVGLIADDEVEIHCHGGLAAVEAVAAALQTEGALRIDSPSWAAQQEPNILSAEAALALASAPTERTAAILLDQQRGALLEAAQRIDGELALANVQAALAELNLLLSWADVGRHLTRPWQVTIAGRPNVGKSSLMNALVGYARSIVFAQPGTTRDVLAAATAFDGWPVELCDTAGIHTTGDELEAAGIERARRQVAGADLVLLVGDVTTPWSSLEQELLASARPVCVVHNKCDLQSPPVDGRPAGALVSALTGQGIEQLGRQIAAALVPNMPPPAAAVPFTERQVALLESARSAIDCGDVPAARGSLAEFISGQSPMRPS